VTEDQVTQAVQDALRRGLVQRNELLTAAQSRGGRARKVIERALTMVRTAT
jgi:hypothetical protein